MGIGVSEFLIILLFIVLLFLAERGFRTWNSFGKSIEFKKESKKGDEE